MSDIVKDYLRWILGVEGAPAVELSEIGLKTSIDAGISAFAVALGRVFEDDPTPEKAAEFVSRIRGRWVKPEKLNPVLAEQVILNVYGEDGLVDDVPAADVAVAENLITYGIVHELGISGASFEDFLNEVVDLMNEPAQD